MIHEAFNLIATMHTENAKHVTKKYGLRDMRPSEILQKAAGEMIELAAEKESAEVLDELSDVIACLLHFAIYYGFSLNAIGTHIVRKLHARFVWESKV